jgi:alpha-glucosidase
MWHMIKDSQWRNNPVNADYQPHMATYEKLVPAYSTDQPEIHDIVARMRRLTDEYNERLIIGEIYLPVHKLVTYYGVDNSGAHLPFNFQLIGLPWNARTISTAVDLYEAALPQGGWPNWVLGNHDQSRIASRVGKAQARVAAILLLTLRGTPTIYYGDEIGMRDVPIPPEEWQDPQGLNMPDLNLSRDPFRTPMQWNDGPYGGFTLEKPWLRLPDNYKRVNVQVQRDNPESMLTLYHRLIQLRRTEPALRIGNYIPVVSEGNTMAFIREWDNRRFLIVLNLGHGTCHCSPHNVEVDGKIILSTIPEREGLTVSKRINLYGDEGMIIKLQ